MTKGGAAWQNLPACDVERACSYISDDGFVASYFGISRAEVQAIRAEMQKPPHREPATDRNTKHGDPISSNDTATRSKAEDSSIRLLGAIERMFERFAHRHGLTIEKARELQLKGYRL